jgi:hypothetical protein
MRIQATSQSQMAMPSITGVARRALLILTASHVARPTAAPHVAKQPMFPLVRGF